MHLTVQHFFFFFFQFKKLEKELMMPAVSLKSVLWCVYVVLSSAFVHKYTHTHTHTVYTADFKSEVISLVPPRCDLHALLSCSAVLFSISFSCKPVRFWSRANVGHFSLVVSVPAAVYRISTRSCSVLERHRTIAGALQLFKKEK